MKICDVVLFLKQEGAPAKNVSVWDGARGRDDNKNIDYFTWCSVHQLVIIHPFVELGLMEQLSCIQNKVMYSFPLRVLSGETFNLRRYMYATMLLCWGNVKGTHTLCI